MGGAQTQPVDDSSDSSDSEASSSGSDEENPEKQHPPRKQEAAGRQGHKGRGATKTPSKQKKEEAKQESERSSSAASSHESRSEPASARELARPPLPLQILRCCCGSGMEMGVKDYLQDTPTRPEMLSSPLEPPDNQEAPSVSSKERKKGDRKGKKPEAVAPTLSNIAALGSNIAALADFDDTASQGGRSARSDFSVSTAVVAQHRNNPAGDASSLKASLKDFVKSLVKGRDLHMLNGTKSGGLRSLGCCLTPEVDAILIADRVPQRILLKDILHVHHGLEAVPLDLEYASSLDANIMVMELSSGNAVSFNLGHPKAAEDFVLYMRLLTAMGRQKARKQGGGEANNQKAKPADDDDDAKSECSVQSTAVKKQLNSMPMSSVTTDPREAKHMFHMFRTTMKRGKEFYVLKADGSMQDVECVMSSGHDIFRMRWDFQTRDIPLRDMFSVLTMQQAAQLNLSGPGYDDRCATVELNTGECITFKFGHTEACDRFVFCMRMLVDQKRERFVSGLEAPAPGAVPFSRPPDKFEKATSSRSSRRSKEAPALQPPKEADPQAEVETFVRQMVIGCPISVIGSCGPTEVQCSMDPELRALKLTASDGSNREVEVAEVKTVSVGKEAEKLGLDGLALDPLCATLELKSDDCLTFRFPDLQQRDRFALCIRIFASARQAEK